MMSRTPVLVLGLLTLAPSLALAQDHKPPAKDPVAARMQWSIDAGVKWLIAQQQPNGTWNYPNHPMKLTPAYPMGQGVTALCAYTLLKCGIGPNHPAVKKAFAYIQSAELRWTYAVGCTLLALEAKVGFTPGAFQIKPPGTKSWDGSGSKVREKKDKGDKKWKKGRKTPADMALAKKCVDWLVAHQRPKGMWRYAGGNDEDASNAQYAMLGLDAAERMGIKVPRDCYLRAATRLIEWQAKTGEKVDHFPVPGADSTYRALRKIEKQLQKEIYKINKKFKKKKPGEMDKKGKTKDDHMHSAERKITGKVVETLEKASMVARGWAYFPPEAGDKGQKWKKDVTGAMTTSALAALFICKSRLEGVPDYERKLRKPLNKALRDGSAWMAKNYSIVRNPNGKLHHYYYLYGLERAGILGVVQRFGKHDWFEDGVGLLLGQQKPEGFFKAMKTTSGPVPDTCFALLFIARGTTPVVRIPGRVVTGSSRTLPGRK